ncbi:LPO_1073/Vpar_1526 family protein [candidate division KSB1 bacterium]
MEPISLSVVITSAAVGAFTNKLIDKGEQWLIDLVGSHSPAVQKKARENFQNFLNRLAKRVELLESELPSSQKKIFDDALDHPGTSLLMQNAMLNAAITDNDDRHTILSEMIAQRLTAGADDMITLIGAAACDVTNSLASKHIKLLGLMAYLFSIRPSEIPVITEQKEYDEYLLSFWKNLEVLSDDLDNVTPFDFIHLQGVSCVSYNPSIRQSLAIMLKLPVKSKKFEITMAEFEKLSWWNKVTNLWGKGITYSNITSVGTLIGILYYDSITKTKTHIDLD